MGFRIGSCCCSLSKVEDGSGSDTTSAIVKKSDLPYIQKDLGDLEWYKKFLPKSEKGKFITRFIDWIYEHHFQVMSFRFY